jgi:O-antigen biosynthesis protein
MSEAHPHQLKTTLVRILRMLPDLGIVRRVSRGPKSLFNTDYYLACNPDVAASKIPPFVHFLIFGAFEGRKPNPLFDPEFYLREYPDVARAEINPLVHYLKCGVSEGRSPHLLFGADSGQAATQSNSMKALLSALEQPPEAVLYSWWMRQEGRITPPPLAESPRFSLLLSISKPRREWLEETIASVRAQTYPHWELCLSINGSTEPWLKDYVELAIQTELRIRLVRIHSPVPTSVSLNRASALATGDYLAVLGQEDRLSPDALHWMATSPPADLIYSDEDRLDAMGNRAQPIFKPDWSPELLLSCMYIGRLMAISRAVWDKIGGFRPEREDARDYDLALRVTENGAKVRHVPHVLYSRRCGDAAYHAEAAGPGARSLRPRGTANRAAPVSVIICSRSPQLLERCMASLAGQTSYPDCEAIVVQHLDGKAEDLMALQAIIEKYGAVRVTYSGPFNFSRMNNLAVRQAKGDILVFLNDDTEPLESLWLDRLVAQVERPGVAIAGARLLYPSGTLQHAGVAVGIGVGCLHIGRNTNGAVPHWPWLDYTRDVSAVTGACLAIRRTVFSEVGGFDEEFPVNYNDIDLCLRVREAGYRVIYESGAILRHYECQTRKGTVSPEERGRWRDRWATLTDPFYNPNLTREHDDLSLGMPCDN